MIEKRKRPYSPARAFIFRAARWLIAFALPIFGWNLCGMSLHFSQNHQLETLALWWKTNEPVSYRYEVTFVEKTFDYSHYRITVRDNQIVLIEEVAKGFRIENRAGNRNYKIDALIEFASTYLKNPYPIQITTGWDTLVTTDIRLIDNIPVPVYVFIDRCGRGIFSEYLWADPFTGCETYFEIHNFEILER